MMDNGSLKFIHGSIADHNILYAILTGKTDLVFCNLTFYQLDTKHKVDFIDFLGQNASNDTTFIFSFHTASISIATEDYMELTDDRENAEKIMPQDLDSYPPLFDRYFTVRQLERPKDQQYNRSYVMRKSLAGPFIVPDSKTRYTVHIARNKGKMYEVLNKWASKKNLHFKKKSWENEIDKYGQGRMIFLESDKGEILGLAFYHKDSEYMFDMDEDGLHADHGSIYFLDRMEVDEKYRKKRLGEKLMARLFEEALNDPHIGNRVVLTEPETEDSDRFFQRIGGRVQYVQRNNFTLDLSEEEKWRAHHRLFYRNSSEKLLAKIKQDALPEQLELVFAETENEKTEQLPMKKTQLSLFEDQPLSNIDIVPSDQYEEYMQKFEEIREEEKWIAREIWRETGEDEEEWPNQTLRLLDVIIYDLALATRQLKETGESGIEALFIVKDDEDKIIGACILYKEKTVESLGEPPAVELSLVVRQRSRRSGTGIDLIKTASQYLSGKGYDRFIALIGSSNEKSRRFFKAACETLGYDIEESDKLISRNGEIGKWYTVRINPGNSSRLDFLKEFGTKSSNTQL